ncbi:hypothetical protein [Pseudomonas sp. GD03944]|uniref:hypothetical protein n=1 Tax=Pseudomonas sp. GD03944 TaxID=2975409 RepID=UPI0024480E5E|nr:hypothetical protein [Pseudomonas sp. GD03944]MDH1263849.1 hypothetical protein [Pseudomonas sp. GD03944]MDH1263853.1 hypothetical protein [Pseudomonas sp. GD03944]
MNYLTVASLVLISFKASAYGNPLPGSLTLCRDDDEVYFSCVTKRLKTISLCGNSADGEISSLTYYFGSPSNLELTQSSSQINGFEPFRFNHYARYGTDYSRISFIRGGYKYEIYSNYDANLDPMERSGIVVTPLINPTEEIDIGCEQKIIDNITPLFSTLKCDDENALGCAK